MWIFWLRPLHVEGSADVKALRQEHVWPLGVIPVWVEQDEWERVIGGGAGGGEQSM